MSAAIAVASCGIFTVLLLSLARVDGIPWYIPTVLIGFGGLSAWRPSAALKTLAAAIPVASWVGRLWNEGVAWPETLVVAFVAGYSASQIRRPQNRPDSLSLPLFAFATVVIGSLAVRMLVLWATIGGSALVEQLAQLTRSQYFLAGGFPEVDAAMRLLEGMVLLRAASRVAQNPAFGPHMLRWFVAGAAAAGALNLWRIWQGALRTESAVRQFVEYLATLRYNVHYGDVNAAGSYYVMALFVAAGLVLATRGARWVPALILIVTSLALSGSRGAFLSGAIMAAAWTALQVSRRLHESRSRLLTVSVIVLLIGGAASVYFVAARRNLTKPSIAISIRVEFVRTTLRMLEAYPAFGVGVGRYPAHSSSFSSPLLVQTYEIKDENAHNNFLQVLGELGVVGFAAFLWVLWAAAKRSDLGLPLEYKLAGCGVLAFVLTWFAGHPLLIDEPALCFWLLLGTLAGAAATETTAPVWRQRRLVVAGFALATALSIPSRAQHWFAAAELEHVGIGLSSWQHGEDGRRYRLARSWSVVFVPSNVPAISLPLRAARPGTELVVLLRLNGRPANAVRVPSDRWLDVHLMLPPKPDAPRFSRLELYAGDQASADAALLMVGEVKER